MGRSVGMDWADSAWSRPGRRPGFTKWAVIITALTDIQRLMIFLSLSNSQFPSFVVNAIWNFELVQYATTICPKMSPKNYCVPFVLSRLDYSLLNSLLAGCPKPLLSKLQKVQNNDNAAKPIFRTTRSALVTPMLHSLHWLPTAEHWIETAVQVTVRCYSRCERTELHTDLCLIWTAHDTARQKITENHNTTHCLPE